MQSKVFNKSNLLSVLMFGLLLAFMFVPAVKAAVIRGLMFTGLFNVDVSKPASGYSWPGGLVFEQPDGRRLSSDSLAGKVVVINFWATWCPPCLAEMPSLDGLYRKFAANKQVVFIAVDADSDFNKSSAFMAKHNYVLPLYRALVNMPPQVYEGSLPTTVIFDKKGKMVFRHQGAANYGTDDVERFIRKLIKE